MSSHPPRSGPVDILIEVDGVVADISKRAHLLKTKHVANWISTDVAKEFYAQAFDAESIGGVTDLVAAGFFGHPDMRIIVSTGRPSLMKAETLEWLFNAGIRNDAIIMRPGWQGQPEWKIKKSNLKHVLAAGFNPVLALEWDEASAAMYAEHGIPSMLFWKKLHDDT